MAEHSHARVHTAHRKPGHRPVPFVTADAIGALDKGDDVAHKQLRENPVIVAAVQLHHAAAHDDEHRHGLAAENEPVEDEIRPALMHPARLVFAKPMLQVEDGISSLRIEPRRLIDQTALQLPRDRGREVVPRHRAVRPAGGLIKAVVRCGHIEGIDGAGRAEADGQIGREDDLAVRHDIGIVKAGPGVKAAAENAVILTAQRKRRAIHNLNVRLPRGRREPQPQRHPARLRVCDPLLGKHRIKPDCL